MLKEPGTLLKILQDGLKLLWQVHITSCPSMSNLDKKLKHAAIRVDKGLCDTNYVEPYTYGPNGFKNPEALLDWLINNRP